MTAEKSYEVFKTLFNALNRSEGIDVPKSEYVLMFNKVQKEFIEQTVPEHNSGVEIQDMSEIIVPFYKLSGGSNKPMYREFDLPDNFFRAINSYSVCSKGSCTGRIVHNFHPKLKPQDIMIGLVDENMKPSFEYQDAPVTYLGRKMQVYKEDFEISEQYVSYYKYPADIDLAGYVDLDNKQSVNKDPELRDVLVNKIIDRVVKLASGIYPSESSFQVAQERIQSEPKF